MYNVLFKKDLWASLRDMNLYFELPNYSFHIDVVNDTLYGSKNFIDVKVSYDIKMYIDFTFSNRSAVLHQ